MTIRSSTAATRPIERSIPPRASLATASSLLLMAVLASVAQFGVLKTLVVPADAAATTANIDGSLGLFGAAVVAFLIVAILDVAVAWGFYVLLRPAGERLARLVGGLRVIYAAAFAITALNLIDAAQLIHGATPATLASAPLQAHVAASISSFDSTWHLALGIFGLHLVGLGGLLLRFAAPRPLAALVVLAGVGYVADSIGTWLIAGYGLSVSTITFVGEALLIVWLFRSAARAFRSSEAVVDAPSGATATAAS